MVNNKNGQGFLHQDKFTLFPDTYSEAYFQIMATYVQENWAHESTVKTFSKEKNAYLKQQGEVLLLVIQ